MNIKGKARFLGYHVFNKCYSFVYSEGDSVLIKISWEPYEIKIIYLWNICLSYLGIVISAISFFWELPTVFSIMIHTESAYNKMLII